MEENKLRNDKPMTEEEKIALYRGLILIMMGIMLISFFFGWCYIYNTDYGVEVGCNGWNFICQSFSWNFTSPDKIYGDMAVPFYHYAEPYVVVLEVFTMVSFYLTLIMIALAACNIRKPHRKITTVFMIVSIIYSLSFIGSFIVALTMNGSRILKGYCGGNPACSIQSLIIFPFLFSLIVMILNIVLRYKLGKHE